MSSAKRLYGDFRCLGHRGGFGSMQRLVKAFLPVEWVPADARPDVGLFWADGIITPDELAAFPGKKVLYVSATYTPSMAPPGSVTAERNKRYIELAGIADVLCHTSRAHRGYFARGLSEAVKAKPWTVLPPIYDGTIYYPPSQRVKVPVIVSVCLWRDWFRWLTILEAFSFVIRKNPAARLILAGSWIPPAKENQMAVARELGVHEYVGWHEVTPAPSFRDEEIALAQAYHRGTVFVHTRFADWGTLTCMEAMATGLPVVCGDNGGLPEFGGNAALTVPYGSDYDVPVLPILPPDVVARRILDAHRRRRPMRARALARAKPYEVRTVMPAFLDWIMEVTQ